MSLWQLSACVDGFNRKQGGDQTKPPTPEEFDAMLAAHADFIDRGARGLK